MNPVHRIEMSSRPANIKILLVLLVYAHSGVSSRIADFQMMEGSTSASNRKGGGGILGTGGKGRTSIRAGARNKGGIWAVNAPQEGYDSGPPCCQICTEKVYHSIALLQLPENVEKEAVHRFHRYHLARTENSRYSMQNKFRFAVKKSTVSSSIRKKSNSGEGKFIGGGGAVAGAPEANAYDGFDVLEALQQNVEKAKQKGPEGETKPSAPPLNYRGFGGAATSSNGIPCCKICPLWFIPTNQKFYAQGDIQPEYGRAFLETSASIQNQKISNIFDVSMSRGSVGHGVSRCCSVCTDIYFPSSRDINEVSDITFAEVEETKGTNPSFVEVKARMQEQLSSKSSHIMLSKAQEGCCTLCNERASGGWSGQEPFSDPESLDQYLENQSEDPNVMREIADKRSWSHSSTTSNHFLQAAKAIDALSQKIGGGGLSSMLRL